MDRLKPYFIFFIVAFVISSCGNKNKDGNIIPASASMVAHLNLASMSKNISGEDLKNSDWLRQLEAEGAPKWAENFLNHPDSTGISFNKGITFFANQDSAAGTYAAFTGMIKDKALFTAFNKHFASDDRITTEGKISLMRLQQNSAVGWNNDRFIYVFGSNFSLENPNEDLNATTSKMDAVSICKNLFNLPAKNSLAKNMSYSDLMHENADVHLWFNGEQLAKSDKNMGPMSMFNSDIFFKDNYSTIAINFNNGQIDIHQKQYTSKELMDFFKKYSGSEVNKNMIKRIPAENIFGVLAINSKPDAVEQFLKLTGLDGIANMFLQSSGLTLTDISQANDGNILVAVADRNGPAATPDSTAANRMDVLLAMGVKNKQSAEKLVTTAKHLLSGENTNAAIVLNDNMLAGSNSAGFADDYLQDKSKNDFSFLKDFTTQPIAAFLDLQKVLLFLKSKNQNNSETEKLYDENLKMWRSVILNGGGRDGKAFSAKMELRLMDEKTNSLKQLQHYAATLYQMGALRTGKNTQNADSLLIPPQIDTVGIPDTQHVK